MRFSKTGWTMMAALAMVAMMSQVSIAQNEQGRRGRGGREGGFGGPPSSVRLLTSKEVQTALKITDEQKAKLEKINDEMQKMRDDVRKAFDDGKGREKMQELIASVTTKVNEVLDEGQQKRLMGIFIQVAGANATGDAAVVKELNLTDDQKKKLDEVRKSNQDAMREAYQGSRDQTGAREEMRAKFEKMREDGNKKLMAVLTSEQQAKLESLKGEKVEIDMSQLRGGGAYGPGGRGGDRRPGGRGGDRNQEKSKSEEKSSN